MRQSIHLRDSYFTVDVDKVKPWYEAMKTFVSAMNEHAAKFKTKEGELFFILMKLNSFSCVSIECKG